MMKKPIILVSSSLLLAAVLITTVYLLLVDRSVDKALAIQRQMTTESPPPQLQRQLFQDLTRMVDKMDREQLRAVSDQVREQSREVFQQNLDEYLGATEAERDAILDRHLEVSQQWSQVYTALRTDAFRGRRRGPRSDRNAQGQNDNRRGDAARRDRERRGNAEQNDERREQYAAYWNALRNRAEEQGVDLGRMGRRGGRRGRNG